MDGIIGKKIRISRILKEDGKTLISALDHGGEDALVKGLEHMDELIKTVIENNIDAVLINEGILIKYHETIRAKVPVILNVPLEQGFAEYALKLGADAIKTTYFGPVPIPLEIANKMRIVAKESNVFGIPYLNEYIPLDENNKISTDVDLVARAARAAAEYGADIVKTSYAENFKYVTESCPVPVIIAGGDPKFGDIRKILEDVIKSGGAGGAIGRSIFQSDNPGKTVRDLVKIVHGRDK
ncbi:MAG: class I fructose-bisphosphate aldolase [Thermoplasmata archaeon]